MASEKGVIAYLNIHKPKTKLAQVSTTDLARIAAPKGAQLLYNILRVGPRVILRSAFELLRANTVTRVLSSVVLLSIDTISLLRGSISYKQYMINVILAILMMIGGTAGWTLGSNAVSHILAENVIIGLIAGLIGAGIFGTALGMAWDKVVRRFIHNDEDDMLDICNHVFDSIAKARSWDLDKAKAEALKVKLTPQKLRKMFISKDRETFARQMIEQELAIDEAQEDISKVDTAH